VVAERLGYDRDEALSLGKCLAGLNAQAKGRSLGIFSPAKSGEGKAPKKVGLGEEFWIEICGRPFPAKKTADGIRAVVKDKPIDPATVETYLAKKFGDDLAAVRKAMTTLTKAFKPADLAEALLVHLRQQVDQFGDGLVFQGRLHAASLFLGRGWPLRRLQRRHGRGRLRPGAADKPPHDEWHGRQRNEKPQATSHGISPFAGRRGRSNHVNYWEEMRGCPPACRANQVPRPRSV